MIFSIELVKANIIKRFQMSLHFIGHPELDNDGMAGVQSNHVSPPPAGGQQQAGNYIVWNIHFSLPI